MLAMLESDAKPANALRLAPTAAAVSLITVPAGISAPAASACATVIGAGVAVAAFNTVSPAADTFTVLVLAGVGVAAVVTVLTADTPGVADGDPVLA